jgi:NAD(P)H-dependent FMN reductase
VVREAAKIVQELGAKATVVDLRDIPMPFYDGDLENASGLPENALKLQKQITDADLIVISTAEYNASIPAILKNAIDWTSRGPNRVFKNKRFVLLSASPGKNGGKRALVHLRTIVEAVGGKPYEKQISFGNASDGIKDTTELKELLQMAVGGP